MRPKEIPICGLAAVLAQFERDPAAIKRLFYNYDTSRRLAKLSSYLAAEKKIYRVVLPEELEKISGTVHHGGVVAIIDAKPLLSVTERTVADWVSRRVPLLVLDRIGNAHNLGAIARTAAFFGLEDILLSSDEMQAQPGEAAYRVAEGGLQHIRVWSVLNLPELLSELASQYEVVGSALSATAVPLPKWAAKRRGPADTLKPVALVLGNEEHGISDQIARVCTVLLTIPGKTDRVQSLNVSAAGSLLMWEIWGRHR
jgi:RNA methyltransferase, TrmH family